jgi:hypothetical protein
MAEREELHLDDRSGGVFEPDVVLPAQFFATLRRKAAGEGERRLRIAVLEDAVHCYQKHVLATDPRGRQLFREAEEWIMERDGEGPGFSFEGICDVLGLDADYIRAGLQRWRERELADAYTSGRVRALQRCEAARPRGHGEREKAAEPLRRASGG